ncbi:hypothetical protein AKO1_011787 [Acrasis kona]|uniref:YqaE/Pmp3 family membrane protein n=1 Tax=Acrasis kona TaxID=1008807 RepID=A0AAW2Z6F5_9EUKA
MRKRDVPPMFMLLSIVLPPFAVFILYYWYQSVTYDEIVKSTILTLLGWVPGVIHANILIKRRLVKIQS